MSYEAICSQCNAAFTVEENEEAVSCPVCGAAQEPTSTQATASIMVPPPIQSTAIPPPAIKPVMQPAEVMSYGELQHAAIYVAMTRSLRGIGIGQIIWGVLLTAIWFAITLHASSTGNEGAGVLLIITIVIACFGAILIAVGIWLIVSPSAIGLLIAAISMFVVAAISIRGILVSLILIFYGIALIKRYKKYGDALTQRPTPALKAQAEQLLNKLQKARGINSPDLLEFNSSDAFSRNYWKGLMMDNLVILVEYEARIIGRSIGEVFFLAPYELNIDMSGKKISGKWLKAKFIIRELKFNGKIPTECYARYENWVKQHTLVG